VLIGPEAADDAGVFVLDGRGLIATADFITPVCDDPVRFGRVAAANSLSDVYAMGGTPIFALNLCCVPPIDDMPEDAFAEVLRGGSEKCAEAGAAVLGGHSIRNPDLLFGLAVVGVGDPGRLLRNDMARPGDKLLLTKPLGTGLLINGFRSNHLDAAALEPALVEMERLNREASRLALDHGVRAAVDVTGFGLAGHALAMASHSGVGLRISIDALPVHAHFGEMLEAGVSTGCTAPNAEYTSGRLRGLERLDRVQREILFDPQTSGGLLLCAPAEQAESLLAALLACGHRAAEIGDVVAGASLLELTRL
jgi:selenide,water dikinase